VPIVLRLARLLREDLENLDAAVRLLAEEAAHPATAADPRLHVRAGDYLMEAGRSTEALQHYLQAERMRPDDPPILERVQRARRDSGVGR
jgi:predicted negative regulator of RcsB-dependent stress response